VLGSNETENTLKPLLPNTQFQVVVDRGRRSACRLMEHSIPWPQGRETAGSSAAESAPDLMVLQELTPDASAVLADAAGADWTVRAIDLRTPALDDSPVRRRGVAIAGHGLRLRRSWLLGEPP
jgi:hypothetical protein